MKRFNAARADRRAANWRAAHAALYADTLEQQLQDSIDKTAAAIVRKLERGCID